VTVRLAVPADAAAIADVAGATFALACPPGTPQAVIDRIVADSLTEAAFSDALRDPERILLVAEPAPGSPLEGYAMVVLAEPEDPAAAIRLRPGVELARLYVREAAHGSGTADALLAGALEAVRETGAAGIWLGTNRRNERSQRFYVKHGFVRAGVKPSRLGDGYEDDVVYERPL